VALRSINCLIGIPGLLAYPLRKLITRIKAIIIVAGRQPVLILVRVLHLSRRFKLPQKRHIYTKLLGHTNFFFMIVIEFIRGYSFIKASLFGFFDGAEPPHQSFFHLFWHLLWTSVYRLLLHLAHLVGKRLHRVVVE